MQKKLERANDGLHKEEEKWSYLELRISETYSYFALCYVCIFHMFFFLVAI